MGAGASNQVQPKYKWDPDHVLRGPWTFIFKEKVQCACEGSKWCTRENPAKQKAPNAIPGLHASWVGDWVLAMARPWQAHVEQYRLVEAFQQHKIGMILNLQEVGEHASCGPGNLPGCGFTYDPETFMAGGVGYYNFSWRDMGVPNLDRMMDIVQVMDYVTRVEGRKVAVHCHAGLGRTGLSIACFFVFTDMYGSAEEAILATRKQRAGAVQTTKQAEFVTIFAKYMTYLRCLFVPRPPSLAAVSGSGSGGPARNGSGSAGGGNGGNGHSLATQSAPPATGTGGSGDAGSQLPTEGLLEAKETGASLVGVYSSGLTVTMPLRQGGGAPGAAAGPDPGSEGLTEEELGLGQHLPWNDTFHIQPQHAKDFRPMPPRSYTEALARQARLIHGPERRAFLRLHKLVKECVFRIIAAAHEFKPPPPAPAAPPPDNQTAAGRSAGAPSTSGSGLPPLPLPPTFAAALAHLIRHHSGNHVDTPGLQPLAAHPAYVALTGPQVGAHDVLSAVSGLKESLNRGRWEGVASAPLLGVVMLLEGFFANFANSCEASGGKDEDTCSLTPECLKAVSKSYQDLFESHVPAPPTGAPPADANGSAAPQPTASKPGGSSASLAVAKQAYEILEPLQPRDSELLLVFAALLRVVARVSGPGCEEAVVEVGKWAAGLLLGSLANMVEAEQAVLSFLWYLAARDEAFAMLVLLKRQRMAGGQGKRSKSSSSKGGVDIAAMLQVAAASLAAPTEDTAAAPAARAAVLPQTVSPAVAAAAASVAAAELPAQAPSVADANAYATAEPPPPPSGPVAYDPNDPHVLPALQLAALLSQDIQQLYRVNFREAIAGISTVLYPPPMATGRIDVHDVWR